MGSRAVLRACLCAGTLLAACDDSSAASATRLQNGGKTDGAGIVARLSDDAPALAFLFRCEAAGGCNARLDLELVDPGPCQLFDDPGCGVATSPLELPHAELQIRGPGLDERRMLSLSSPDGQRFAIDGWEGEVPSGDIEVVLERGAIADRLSLRLFAEWFERADAGPGIWTGDGGMEDADVPDANDGGTTAAGTCGYRNDRQVLAFAPDLEAEAFLCAEYCVEEEELAYCIGECVRDTADLSEGCGDCYGALGACAYEACEADEMECTLCINTSCRDDFSRCSGR